jgi:hypothetical protein
MTVQNVSATSPAFLPPAMRLTMSGRVIAAGAVMRHALSLSSDRPTTALCTNLYSGPRSMTGFMSETKSARNNRQ